MQTYTQYMKQEDKLQAEDARFEDLCEHYEEFLENQNSEAVENFKEWLYQTWFDGTFPTDTYAAKSCWAEEQAEKQMERERTQANDNAH